VGGVWERARHLVDDRDAELGHLLAELAREQQASEASATNDDVLGGRQGRFGHRVRGAKGRLMPDL
jgi:hypothetical protein